MNEAFRLAKQEVVLILAFTGIKLSLLFFHIEKPILLSTDIIIGILSILASVYMPDKANPAKS